ncbi:4Fe-4S dicluster domain-containing protein [[Eubacterium] cellulosolvens]
MSRDDFTSQVINFAKNKGADLVGIASADYLENYPDLKHKPSFFIPKAKAVIIIGLKVNDGLLEFGLSTKVRSRSDLFSPKHEVYKQTLEGYLKYYNYNLLDNIAIETSKFLENNGFMSFPIQARVTDWTEVKGVFPHKLAAIAAGLGTQGKCSLIITSEYGPRVRLVSLITEASLTTSSPRKNTTKDVCGNCRKCIDVCPIDALDYNEDSGTTSIDKMACWKLTLPGRCGLCMAVCPYGRKKS